jgi:hypothetical protein
MQTGEPHHWMRHGFSAWSVQMFKDFEYMPGNAVLTLR